MDKQHDEVTLSPGGVGPVIFSQYFGVGQQNLFPRKGVGFAVLGHHFSKCSGPSPPILIDRSLTIFKLKQPSLVLLCVKYALRGNFVSSPLH